MKRKDAYHVAVVGATGAVGRTMMAILEEREFPVAQLTPLASARSARWMNDNLFGVTVPEATLARLEGAADQAAEGRRICVELIQALREVPHVAGVHIMAPLQGSEAIAAVIEEAG